MISSILVIAAPPAIACHSPFQLSGATLAADHRDAPQLAVHRDGVGTSGWIFGEKKNVSFHNPANTQFCRNSIVFVISD